jgi:hypothetical protein
MPMKAPTDPFRGSHTELRVKADKQAYTIRIERQTMAPGITMRICKLLGHDTSKHTKQFNISHLIAAVRKVPRLDQEYNAKQYHA